MSLASLCSHKLSYKGLFGPSAAPSRRAYCILFGFVFSLVEVTTGLVLAHVIWRAPLSGGHPLSTPPIALAIALIMLGATTLLLTAWVIFKYGFDGDASFDNDTRGFVKDDFLDLNEDDNSTTLPHV